MMKRLIMMISLLAVLVVPYVYADVGVIKGASVVRTLVTGGNAYGGCMVMLDVRIDSVLPNCPGNFITFSCTGDFTTKDHANRMFDTAMMANALGKKVWFVVHDNMKHNGYCYSSRVDVFSY
jgi:hypothetical protein